MKTVFAMAMSILLSTAGFAAGGAVKETSGSFAVVELFGSEGCSSCPPADDLLRELTRQARAAGSRVFTLSYHVDYWNGLGWPDPFSRPQFTRRQYDYARVLKSSSVYTPQMIVNGAGAFVGSDARTAQKFITQALQTPAEHRLLLTLDRTDPARTAIDYQDLAPDACADIHFALVERGLETKVERGENAGSLLKHDNVVREFETAASGQNKGRVEWSRPQGDLSNYSVIAFVQKKDTMQIVAAESIDLQ